MTILRLYDAEWEFEGKTIGVLMEQLLAALRMRYSEGQWSLDYENLTIRGEYQSTPVTIGKPQLETGLVKFFDELRENPLYIIIEGDNHRALANFLASGDPEALVEPYAETYEVAADLLTYIKW